MTEAFLHYLWKHRLLRGELKTTTGQEVLVQNAGEHNHDAGPDFLNARLTIGPMIWAGNVEIHVKASDWALHHHQGDAAYNNVVLHVVYINDYQALTEDGKKVPTLVVQENVPREMWEGYAALMQPALPVEIPCMLRLQEIPSFYLSAWQDRLMAERLERKANDVRRLLDDSKGNWETCCYWMIARYFGGKTNGFAFEMLAKHTPQRFLGKIKNYPFRIEALLMGQAGLLEGEFTDEYPQKLQKEYQYLSHAYQLTPMEGYLWKFFRLRPAAFPTVRISQLADLIAHSDHLFSRLLETTEASKMLKMFDLHASDYWETHYRFDQEAARMPKSAGRTFAETLIINAWVPLLFEYGRQHDNEDLREQAINLLEQLSPENNRITRLWASAGIPADNAARSQAQIQLYNEYCKQKRCLDCQIGYKILKNGK